MKDLSPWRIRRVAEPQELEPEYVYASDTDEVHLNDYWKILVKRRRLILLVFIAIVGVGAYFTMSATRLYRASATVKIEPQNPQVTGVGALQPVAGGGGSYDYHQTQFALLQNRALAARVVAELNLEKNKTFRSARIVTWNPISRISSWVFRVLGVVTSYLSPLFRSDDKLPSEPVEVKTKARRDLVDIQVDPYLVNRYLGLFEVRPVRNTRLVTVTFDTPNSSLSHALANAHVQGFLRMSLDTRFSLTEEAREFLNQKKAELREKLETSEGALNSFRRAHGVVSVEKGENIVVDRMIDVNRQLTTARAQRIEAESLYRTVENRDYRDLSELMRQGLVQQLKSNIAKLEGEKARVSTIFKPEHPRIQELDQHIAEASRALNNEIENVIRGIKSNYAAALAKERSLQAEAERQQQNALKLKEIGVDYTVLQEEVNANRSLYENVLKRLSETVVSNDIALSNMQIVEYAEKPLYASSPNVPLLLLVYMVVGTMFGVGVALLREYMDSTISTPDEVWRSVGLSTLGVVPHLKFLKKSSYERAPLGFLPGKFGDNHGAASESQTAKELITSQRPSSIVSESYRTIRTAFLLSQAEKPPQAVVITSPAPGEGKTVTTLNLAIALAHDGHSVLVIDADLRKGRCHSRLGLSNNRGLSNVLTGQLSLQDGVQETSVKGLSLLSRGILPPNPAELLGSQKMKEVLHELREKFQFLLIDSPPVVAVSDAAVLSVISDGVLLVLDGQKTSAASTRKAVERLEMVRAPMLGVVLNGVNLDNPDYSYYRTYTDYYDSAFEEQPEPEEMADNSQENANGGLSGSTESPSRFRENGNSEDEWKMDYEKREDEAIPPISPVNEEDFQDERSTAQEPESESDEAAGYAENEPDVRAAAPRRESETSEAPPTEDRTPERQEVLPRQFMERLTQTLLEAVGPIAPLLVTDRIAVLGESPHAFPKRRLGELVQLVKNEIANERLKARFQDNISRELRSLE